MTPQPHSDLLSPKDISQLLGVSGRTLRRWMVTGYFPPPIRLNRRTLRWEPDAVRAWLRAQQEGSPCSRTA